MKNVKTTFAFLGQPSVFPGGAEGRGRDGVNTGVNRRSRTRILIAAS